MRWAVGTLLLLGCIVQTWADEWEEDDEVVVEDDVPEPVDPAAEARANHARMHGAPEWASDPQVLVSAENAAQSEHSDIVRLMTGFVGRDGGTQGQGAPREDDDARGCRSRLEVSLDSALPSAGLKPRLPALIPAFRARIIFESPELQQKFNFLQSVSSMSLVAVLPGERARARARARASTHARKQASARET